MRTGGINGLVQNSSICARVLYFSYTGFYLFDTYKYLMYAEETVQPNLVN